MRFFRKLRQNTAETSPGQSTGLPDAAGSMSDLLNCTDEIDSTGLRKNLLPLAAGVLAQAEHLPQEQAALYEIAYSAQMIAAHFADINLAARDRIYQDSSHQRGSRLDAFLKIHERLIAQGQSDLPYVYETGYLYQGIDSLGLMGSRDAEERYHSYEFYNHLTPGSTILDVGANCGFMGLFVARNLGCHAVCVDHNAFMLDVGKIMAEYYGVGERMSFSATPIQEMQASAHDAVFSFASHWTDEGGIRNALQDHFALLMSFLEPGGRIFFESHCNDLTDENYETTIAQVQAEFGLEIRFRRLLDNDTRDYIVFQHVV